MKFFNHTAILSVLILFTLSACSPRHHHEKMECPMKKDGGQMMQRMADSCANQLASINNTKEILSAASTSKSSSQAKAAMTKASDELTRAADLLSVCCSHMKMMGEGHHGCRCGMQREGGCKTCKHDMAGGEACGCHKQ